MTTFDQTAKNALLAELAAVQAKWTTLWADLSALTPVVVPPPPPATKSVTVSTIAALKAGLADSTLDEIVVADGRYLIATAQAALPNSLSITQVRTRPVIVRPTTPGGVTFHMSGGGGAGTLGIWFGSGACFQEWDGFILDDMIGTPVEFGGFTPSAPAHDITLRRLTLAASCHRAGAPSTQEHAIYFSNALGRGPYNILIEDATIFGTDPLGLWGGIHAYHGDAANPPADHVTIRRLTTTGLTVPIVLWDTGAVQHDWLFDGATIKNALQFAIRFESVGAQNIVFKDIVSTGTPGGQGFYSSLGATPPGVTFVGGSLG